MANEATVRCSLTIRKGNLFYQNRPGQFQADVSGTKGGVPGAITVPTTGVDISFTELTDPGLYRVINLSDTYKVTLGVHDGILFHPFHDILPGEEYVNRLASGFGEEVDETGTGTTGPINTLRAKATGGSAVLVFEAFES